MKTLYARPLLAAILDVTLVGGPVSPAFGQDALVACNSVIDVEHPEARPIARSGEDIG